MDDHSESVRLDVWLWAARWFKTRPLAKRSVELGRVQVNDAPAKPARALRVGDLLRIERGGERFEVKVLALADRRGCAAEAQRLYAESAASEAARRADRALRRMTGAQPPRPPRRPDKRDRRALRQVGRGAPEMKSPQWFFDTEP